MNLESPENQDNQEESILPPPREEFNPESVTPKTEEQWAELREEIERVRNKHK